MADVNFHVIKCKLNVYYLPLKLEYILKAGKCLSKKLEVEFPTDSIILLFTKAGWEAFKVKYHSVKQVSIKQNSMKPEMVKCRHIVLRSRFD